MTKENLIEIIQDSIEEQNQISNEIIDFLVDKQRELTPLTQKILSAQKLLYDKYEDDEDYENQNESWDMVFELVNGGRLLGYDLDEKTVKSIIESKK